MEFKLLNIEETLERSRKVLMNSMEATNYPLRSPLCDRTNEIKSKDNQDPEDYRIYLDKIKYLSVLKSKDSERRQEMERLANDTPKDQELSNKLQIIDHLKLDIERSQVRNQNEELKKKIKIIEEEALDAERIQKTMEEIKREKEALEYKYRKELTPANQREIIEIKNQVKELQERSQVKFHELSKRLEKLLNENTQLNNLITPHQPLQNDMEKYKTLVKSLQKKLKSVSKKYKELKKKDKSFSQRNQSVGKKISKVCRESSKKPHTRLKSTERNLTPNRLPH